MTQYSVGDESKTSELVRQRDADTTWLRHRGRAAELDRRLLEGATESELAEVRQSWKGHIKHLVDVHCVRVAEEPTGFWRIVGVHASKPGAEATLEGAAESLGNDDDYGDGGDSASYDSPVSAHDNLRLQETAQALAALAKENLLGNELLKASVAMLVRQASESRHWPTCAHYRSKAAAQLIREAQAGVSASSYQRFCSQNLRHEHVVPIAVIYKMLCKAEDTSVEAIAALLVKFSIRATITRDEDRELGKRGLSYEMPEEFVVKGSALHGNPMARYIAAELADKLEKRPAGKLL